MHFGFRISDFGFTIHPPGLFNAKAQRRKDARSTQPPILPTDHTDQHRFTHPSQKRRRKERQNPCATGASAGVRAGCDERSRSEQAVFSPVTGDHQIACCSAVNKRDHFADSAFASLRLCVSAPLRFFWSSPLVSWCLGVSSFSRSSENPS